MSPDAVEALALALFIELEEGPEATYHEDPERLGITIDDYICCRELAERILRRLNLPEKQ